MPIDRYFSEVSLEESASICLEGQEFHHLVHVARLRIGEEAEIVDGKGTLAHARLESIHKKEALLAIQHVEKATKPSPEIILAQAIPRLNRLETIMEKATELGVTQFWLFPGDLSERKSLTEHQLERLRAITIAALKQSGRLWLPDLHVKPSIKEWTKLPYHCFFGDVSPDAKLLAQAMKSNAGGDFLIVIGPESGLTDGESDKLRHLDFGGVKLCDSILRTDTAAILATGLASHFLRLSS